jgi:hypothetical protein
MNRCMLVIVLVAGIATSTLGQGFTPPKKGNAVVYFTRLTAMGFAISFDYFDSATYIGQSAGRNYLRYECQPGRHLFWASSENKAFVTADLEANQTYVVIVDVLMGIGVARVGLTPIDSQHKLFPKAKQLILKKAPDFQAPDFLATEGARLSKFIREKLAKYESDWKSSLDVRHIGLEMGIPAEKAI